MISIGFLGFLLKLFKPSESNLLFDGSSLVLYFIGVIIYLTNILQGLALIDKGDWEKLGEEVGGRLKVEEGGDRLVVGKEDSMRVLAASNTILALVLVGVLVLQAGQWYAEKREGEERREWAVKEAQMKKEGGKAVQGSKKKN